jgi:hypothetical protein
MSKVELRISALVQGTGPQYMLLLEEVEGTRRIPVIIGTNEAQSIAMALNEYSPPRPMTHDLFMNTLTAFGIVLNEVVITKVEDSIFYSELVCEHIASGTIIRIDSRTSDAISLSVRFKSKIYAETSVIDAAGISFLSMRDDIDEKSKLLKKIHDLETQLQREVRDENYEEASKIRDEIKKLKDQLKSIK